MGIQSVKLIHYTFDILEPLQENLTKNVGLNVLYFIKKYIMLTLYIECGPQCWRKIVFGEKVGKLR